MERISLDLEALKDLFHFHTDATMVLDNRGIVRAFNPAAEALFGWKVEEVVGKAVCGLLFECSLPERLLSGEMRSRNFRCPALEVLKRGYPADFLPLLVLTKSGEQLTIIANRAMIPGPSPDSSLMIVVMRASPSARRMVYQALYHGAGEILLSKGVPREIRSGRLRISLKKREAWMAGRPVHLTPVEFALLWCLATHRGITLSRDELLALVWGPGFNPDSNVVDVHIKHLREKIEPDPRNPSYILSVRGYGYRFSPPEDRPALERKIA